MRLGTTYPSLVIGLRVLVLCAPITHVYLGAPLTNHMCTYGLPPERVNACISAIMQRGRSSNSTGAQLL